MSTVLLVEDDLELQNAAARALRLEGFTVVCASSLREALTSHRGADVILLDLGLPDADGFRACNELVATGLPVVIATARDSEIDKIVCLEMGADDFIQKPYSLGEAAARLRAVLRRGVTPSRNQERLTCGELVIDSATREVLVRGSAVDLTAKEFDLLVLLVRKHAQVVHRQVLLNEVWGADFVGSGRTLDTHVGSLRRKIGSALNIESMRNVGFCLRAGE